MPGGAGVLLGFQGRWGGQARRGPRGRQSRAALRIGGISILGLDSLILPFIEEYSYIDGVK